MLSIGTLKPFDSASLLSPNRPFSSTGPLPPFSSKNSLCLSSSLQTQHIHLSFKIRHNGLSLLCVSALKGKRRKGGTEVVETDGSDFDDFEDYDDGDFFEDGGDDEDEGMFLPFGQMKRWLENKPRGFGEGKVYDTSIEDKLFEEIEQSRQAQNANINKLKNDPLKAIPKREIEQKKAPEDIPSGIRVHLLNLPKKKNIQRDLKSAFEGVPGIVNIIPAVSGNKKTKDPICKGFAFVDFKSEEYATRFVQLFSRESITFGKIQKQIRCEMMNSSSPKSVGELSEEVTNGDPKLTVAGIEEDLDAGFDEDEDFFDPEMEVAADWSAADNELDLGKLEDVRENLEVFSVSELNGDDSTKQVKESATDSFSSNRRKKIQALEKKLIARGKVKKVPKLDIPGSAKRLKVKEKALLIDVFSKYSAKAASISKKEI